jgi:hypothetical protein
MRKTTRLEDNVTNSRNDDSKWNGFYKLGGMAALGAVLVGILEIAITFLPGGNVPHETMLAWFVLFQRNGFMGLRDLGLLNMFLNALSILTYFALYATHRKGKDQPYAALAMVVAFLGVGVFFATNRAFPMLALSNRYAAATTEAQRMILEAAGQSLLSVGQSHTPGTFLAFSLSEVAGILISIVMLRNKIFSTVNAYAGILGFGILLIFEFIASFVSGLIVITMILAMFGGLLSMIWYILIARKLFQIDKAGLPPGDRVKYI